jgi:hypothetical protein
VLDITPLPKPPKKDKAKAESEEVSEG